MKSTQSSKVSKLLKESSLNNQEVLAIFAISKKTQEIYFSNMTVLEWFTFIVDNSDNKSYFYKSYSENFALNNQQYAHWKNQQKNGQF